MNVCFQHQAPVFPTHAQMATVVSMETMTSGAHVTTVGMVKSVTNVSTIPGLIYSNFIYIVPLIHLLIQSF